MPGGCCRRGPAQDTGGYKMSVEFVNAVHRTQTGNLPDPADPAPCRSGISVYFTRHAWGPLDFVIMADRQFKSAPKVALPDPRVENGWAQSVSWDPKTGVATGEVHLLGSRQRRPHRAAVWVCTLAIPVDIGSVASW